MSSDGLLPCGLPGAGFFSRAGVGSAAAVATDAVGAGVAAAVGLAMAAAVVGAADAAVVGAAMVGAGAEVAPRVAVGAGFDPPHAARIAAATVAAVPCRNRRRLSAWFGGWTRAVIAARLSVPNAPMNVPG